MHCLAEGELTHSHPNLTPTHIAYDPTCST